MYESFFGFREKPFDITPDPRFLYLGKKHREALAHLIYGVKQRKGFVVLSGEVGTGKTTLIRALLERLDKNFQIAYVFNPDLSVPGFFKFVSRDFGLHVNGDSKIDYLIKLHDFLLESHLDGKTTVLIVDEAQYLEAPLFKEIRMLTNLETSKQKLLQILLVGQPELNNHLEQPEFRHLKQRISIRYHLLPLDQHETGEYIQTRMRIAGAKRQNCFTQGALKRICEYSGGVPRLINNICDNSLLTAFATDKPIVNEHIVEECAADLRLERFKKTPKAQRTIEGTNPKAHFSLSTPLLIILICLLLAGMVMLFSEKLNVPGMASKPIEIRQSPFHKEQNLEVLGTGVIQHRETDSEDETVKAGFDPENPLPVGAYIDDATPQIHAEREPNEESTGTEVIQTPEASENPATRMVTIRPGESVSEIIFREFGKVDTALLEAVQKLNSKIEDIDRIEAGQRIELPLHLEDVYKHSGSPSYFSVHVASFRRFDEAQRMVNELIENDEKPAIISAKIHERGLWYRVTIGEYQNLAEASLNAKRLVESGRFTYARPIKIEDSKQVGTERPTFN